MIGERRVSVTVTVEVFDGEKHSVISDTRTEACGNPRFTTRVAHRLTETLADRHREMLGVEYGEVDPEWRKPVITTP